MSIAAYAKLPRVPGIGAFGIVPVIGTVAMGATDLSSLTLNPAVFLIFTPIIWYIVCTQFLGEKLFKP